MRARSVPNLGPSALLDGRSIVLIVVVGGLFTLQSSNNLDGPKVAYLIAAITASAIAVLTAPKWLEGSRAAMARPWLIVSCAQVALLVLSLGVACLGGTLLTSWLRDAAAYALFAIAPILALACAGKASRTWAIGWFATSGVLASISFAVVWLGRRAIVELPIDRIVLPSGFLAASFIALATAMALTAASRRRWWAFAAGVVLGLLFASGTRATLLLLAVPIGASLLAGRPWRPALRMLGTEIATAMTIFGLLLVVTGLSNGTLSIGPAVGPGATPTQIRNLSERLGGVGLLVADPASDHSLQERWTQTQAAGKVLASSPIVGVGPGHGFEWTDSVNKGHDDFTLDTPLVYLAKFGLLGLGPLGLFVAAYLRLMLALRKYAAARMEYLLMAGYGIIFIVLGALGSPMEDKGASFGLVFVLTLGLRAWAGRSTDTEMAGPAIGS